MSDRVSKELSASAKSLSESRECIIEVYINNQWINKQEDGPTCATKTPMTAVANSGAEDPAAMNVAPATSGGMFRTKMEKVKFIKNRHKENRLCMLW